MNNYNIEQIYQEMELHLISSMKRNLSRHLKEELDMGFNWTQWQAEKLKEVKRYQRENNLIIKGCSSPINDEVKKQLKEQFIEGSKKEQKNFKKALNKGFKSDKKVNNSFFKINDRKVNKLIDSVNNDLSDANYAILRMMNDEFRQTIHKAATFASNGVMTEKQAMDMATKSFLEKGLKVIKYKNGAEVNIANYSKMAVRTASARAMLQGEGEFRKKIGNSLVKISKHGTACKLCQVWEGQVLVDDVYSGGNPKDYPQYKVLSLAMKMGLYHPNCFHGLGTYYEELEGMEFDEHGATKETQAQYIQDINECNQQIQRFSRLETGSLDETNIQNYKTKKNQWKNKKNNFIKNNKIVQNNIFDTLAKDKKYALNSYISSDSYVINNSIRNGYKLDNRLSKVDDDLSMVLDEIPDSIGVYNRSLWFYDDISKKKFIDSMYEEQIIFKGFTSMSKDVYDETDDVRLILNVKHGKDISTLNSNEKEVLLNKGTKFKLLKSYKKNDKLFFELEEL